MPMVYDVFYWTKNGVRLAGFDSGTFGVEHAPKGEYAQHVNTNHDGHEFWLDEEGRTVEKPDFALTDVAWLQKYIYRGKFARPEHKAAVEETLLAAGRDPRLYRQYEKEFASLRRKVEAGETITLYARSGADV